MESITDGRMRAILQTAEAFTVVIARDGPNREADGADRVIWEHGRRNLQLRADGVMPVVLPISDGTGLAGVFVFDRGPKEARRIMDGDPAVVAGIYVYDVHPCRSWAGDTLPGTVPPAAPPANA
ncbi:hypothetical protein [Glaciibacter sp. 2TAF33]|uniref:hypothetical protein n=1 Tax=Glaciibacter sp. 2TAF33 TaxID=3233015 RepID=UPI003F8E6CB4